MIEKAVKKAPVSPWTRWFWALLFVHAVGIGAWYGSQHPLAALRSAAPSAKSTTINWTTPADFIGEGWPSPAKLPTVAPIKPSATNEPPSPPPVVKGAFIVVHRLTALPDSASGLTVGLDLRRAFDEYDGLIKRCIEDRWTPPKGDADSPARFKLRISVGGIIQNSGVTAKSSVIELNRSAAELLEKLDRTGKPLPEGWASEYEVEVELHAAP